MKKYLGQCDRLRQAGGEKEWQKMMELKKPVSFDMITSSCDIFAILDKDETLEIFCEGDDESGAYESVWGETPCLFIQTHGFEFIWIQEQL